MFWNRAKKYPTEIDAIIPEPGGRPEGTRFPRRHRRRERRRSLVSVAAMASVGCVTSPQLVEIGEQPAGNREVLAIVRLAIQLDASGQSADSLYAPFATIVAEGTDRQSAPRLAGVSGGGWILISDLAGEVIPPLAWAVATYRWTSEDGRIVEIGRGTFLLELISGTWRIKHAHSSVVPPWAVQR